jgi:hypothetical protein
VVALRRHRWVTTGLRTQRIRSCGRAMLSGPLFDGRGLRVTVTPTDPNAEVRIVARHAGGKGKPVKPERVVETSLVRALLRLKPGTWRVSVRVGRHALGSMVARRP